jgi:hypothetical protein
MSQTPTTAKRFAGSGPQWDERQMWRRTRTQYMALVGVMSAVWIALLIWVLFTAEITNAATYPIVGVDLLVILAPVLVVAIVVERLLETIFNTIEGSWRSLVAYLGYGMRWLKSTEMEVMEARQWLQTTSAVYNNVLAEYNEKVRQILNETSMTTGEVIQPGQMPWLDETAKGAAEKTAAAQALVQDAQKRLEIAENKLSSLTDSRDYQRVKGMATIILGLMLGTIIAGLMQMRVFAPLGMGLVPARIDILLTGWVIGSLSWPIRSLSATLSMGRKALQEQFTLGQLELVVRQAEAEARQREAGAKEAEDRKFVISTLSAMAATKPTQVTAEVNIGGDVTGRDKIGDTQIGQASTSSAAIGSTQLEQTGPSSIDIGGDVTGRDKIGDTQIEQASP